MTRRNVHRGSTARTGLVLVLSMLLAGCGALVNRATENFADDLEQAIVNYDEPMIVERGLPTFLLILEARLQANPDNASTRLTTARLTSTYAGLFAEQPDQHRRLARRALEHARTGACQSVSELCALDQHAFEEFEQAIAGLPTSAVGEAYVLGTVWAAWIASASDDFNALSDLPRVEALLEWVGSKDPTHDDGAVWLYLAVLNSQRPPAAGGRPGLARRYYQRAREISNGRNLLIPVLMADEYARLTFDRDLFVELLEGVMAADPDQDGYVLANQVARARARALLDDTSTIFD